MSTCGIVTFDMRTLVGAISEHEGASVTLLGWVDARRDHGKLIFIDLRDRSGTAQVVFLPKNAALYETATTLRSEWVVKITGTVGRRPTGMENAKVPNGSHEVVAETLEVIAQAQTPPFDVTSDGRDIGEEIRMQYRYLDLRRPRLAMNLRLRHRVTTLVRDYLNSQGFVEVETPTLTKTSPEGARDFLVPSRFHPGKFYALPQAPQQYKQLLMVAGIERYYQIAHAFRDEDLRGDRQFEHTQIDLEMSFATEEDVRTIVEGLMVHVAEQCGKTITQKPFPVFTHEEAIKQFGADKFDIRKNQNDPNEFGFAWVTDFPLFECDAETGRLTFAHNPFSAPKAEHVEQLMRGENLASLRAQQYDLVCNGTELASGGVRISNPAVQRKVFEIMGLTPEQTEERFGHLIHAYEYGAPPHAGAAPGLDRLVMLLAGESNIREVIAFPVSANGKTSVMNAPSDVSADQLKELSLKVSNQEK